MPCHAGPSSVFHAVRRNGSAFAIRFLVFLVFTSIVAVCLYFDSPKSAQGSVGLTFRGIEKSRYPSGKTFSVEDFRSQELISQALGDAAVRPEQFGASSVTGSIYVTPVVPQAVQSRWKQQDQAGTQKEEFFPSQFQIAIAGESLTDEQRINFFNALIERYRDGVKADQESALAFHSPLIVSYETLAGSYDFWDVPALFRESYVSLNERLNDLMRQSVYQNPKYRRSFQRIARDLRMWEMTRLQALEALTYQGHLVKDREAVLLRIRFRIQELELQIRQRTEEAKEAMQLLKVVDRPSTVVAGQVGGGKSLPLMDVDTLGRLIKSDYVRPVVERISKLQSQVQAMETEKARLQKRLEWLPKTGAASLDRQPVGYQELIRSLSSEFDAIVKRYNTLLSEYLTASVTSLVAIKQAPQITRGGHSLTILIVAVLFLSAFLALFVLILEDLFQCARRGRGPAEMHQRSQAA